MVGKAADCNKVREDVARLPIYLYLAKHEFFFQHPTVKKTSLSLPAERLSCLYIQWVAYMEWMQYVKSVCG